MTRAQGKALAVMSNHLIQFERKEEKERKKKRYSLSDIHRPGARPRSQIQNPLRSLDWSSIQFPSEYYQESGSLRH